MNVIISALEELSFYEEAVDRSLGATNSTHSPPERLQVAVGRRPECDDQEADNQPSDNEGDNGQENNGQERADEGVDDQGGGDQENDVALGSRFNFPSNESNIRLFNDVVRGVLFENLSLSHIADVTALVKRLLDFMLDQSTCNQENDGSEDVGEVLSESEHTSGNEEGNGDADSHCSPDVAIGNDRLPYSLQSHSPPEPDPTSRRAHFTLDGMDVEICIERVLLTPYQYHALCSPIDPDSSTYDLLTHVSTHAKYKFGIGTLTHRTIGDFYTRQRENPLPGDYCHCARFYGQSGEANLYRRCGLVGEGQFNTLSSRHLFTQREARYQAGLDTYEMDREITRRIFMTPEAYAPLREILQGFLIEVDREGVNYQLR
ncbi:hypothetical protein BU23DRAFT_574245 [Bimuria novae-zelandiae CBS 107.79]|uniref:Uncharacterized protein n=1 Tax=Bimuria novae-zelandiae CBS 107.79 TaxID=1447943 RepID=A0A6A5UYH7_9PLEO|nr:hypothetical protein BU23DRAFT_574245 [Bimuria novae-zelandiae CBS 107.79]